MTEERLKEIEKQLNTFLSPASSVHKIYTELISEIRRLKDAEEKAFRSGYDRGASDANFDAGIQDEAWQQYKERA